MKKLWMLALFALLFTGCTGGLLRNSDTTDATFVVQLPGLRAATDSMYSIDMEMLTEVPHAVYTKSTPCSAQNLASGIKLKVSKLYSGDKVKVKITLKRNGTVLAEGVSEEKEITLGNNALDVKLKKKRNYVPITDINTDYNNTKELYYYDINFFEKLKVSNELFCLEEGNLFADYCVDKDFNLYAVSTNNNGNNILTFFNINDEMDPTNIYEGPEPLSNLCYDPVLDNLYFFVGTALYKTEHPASDNRVTKKCIDEFSEENVGLVSAAWKMTVYNDKLYIVGVKDELKEEGPIQYLGISKDYGITFTNLLNADGIKTGALIQDFACVFDASNDEFSDNGYLCVSDIAVNETGIYILIRNTNSNLGLQDTGKKNYSRGALVKVDFNFTTAKTIGWTETEHVLKKDLDNVGWRLYQPKSINDGFYGPEKILAIKPKELIFTDDGAYIYVYGDTRSSDQGNSNHIVFVDLESLSYTAVETVFKLNCEVSISGSNDSQFNEEWN